MSTKSLHSCDFCKQSDFDKDKIIYEGVVVKGSKQQSAHWEDMCKSCFEKLTKFINSIRK